MKITKRQLRSLIKEELTLAQGGTAWPSGSMELFISARKSLAQARDDLEAIEEQLISDGLDVVPTERVKYMVDDAITALVRVAYDHAAL
jgi:hypothetical protein